MTESNKSADPIKFAFDPSKKYGGIPLAVIVGKPNTGKSTLFNRLVKNRRSITSPEAGVTRDPVEAIAVINGAPVRLMDTGGFKLERSADSSEIDKLVTEKTLLALKKSDLILLLLDPSEITPEDESFIELLRPYWNRVLLLVNKTEGGRRREQAWNYLQYGFSDMLCISAEHGDNISELGEKITARLDFSRITEIPEQTAIKIAVMGKPNTGKSTLVNRLTSSQISIVSNIAGTTRDVVQGSFSYRDKDFIVLDTAGIRKKARVREDVEYYSVNRAIKTLDEADIVFHIIDSADGLTEQDKKIIAHAHKRGRGVIFVLNKWDTQDQKPRTFKAAEERIAVMFAQMEYAPVVPIAAINGFGIQKLLDTAVELYAQLTRKIDTGPLNAALKRWLAACPPPSERNARFRARYMVQSSINPVKFLLFASRPEAAPANYVAYIKNCLRRDLGFANIPVLLEVRASRKKWEEYARGAK